MPGEWDGHKDDYISAFEFFFYLLSLFILFNLDFAKKSKKKGDGPNVVRVKKCKATHPWSIKNTEKKYCLFVHLECTKKQKWGIKRERGKREKVKRSKRAWDKVRGTKNNQIFGIMEDKETKMALLTIINWFSTVYFFSSFSS